MGSQPIQLRGWLPLIFIPGALWTLHAGQRRGLWWILSILCVLFALGPGQLLGERIWRLPYYPLWQGVPFLDRLNHPSRWLGVGGLFLTLAALDGVARSHPRRSWAFPVLVLAQLWGLGNLPLGSWTWEVPQVWKEVSKREGGAVMVLPLLDAPLTARWQHTHKRPLLGGMVENKPWAWPPAFRSFVEENDFLMSLWATSRSGRPPESPYQEDLDTLHQAGFDSIVLDAEAWQRGVRVPIANGISTFSSVLGKPIFVDSSGALWALPTAGRSGRSPDLGLTLPEP